jgi:hypothetical protein
MNSNSLIASHPRCFAAGQALQRCNMRPPARQDFSEIMTIGVVMIVSADQPHEKPERRLWRMAE